jgi:propanol-preferring alcohol dehydrogenase
MSNVAGPEEAMKAALLESDGSVHVSDAPDPSAEDAVVRVKAAGVCGTELHFLSGAIKPNSYPFILGHEVAGVIESLPAGTPVLRTGDRVAVYNRIACGTCLQCRLGREEICDASDLQIGFNENGGFAEFVRVPVSCLVLIPDRVPFEAAAVLACSGMSAVHGVRAADVALGSTAVVNGVGGVGLMVIQAAGLAGANVIAVGDSEQKLDLAREFGASATILAGDEPAYETLPERVRDATGGAGCDTFFELVGTTASMAAGFRALAKGGTFVSIGYTSENISIHPIELILKENRLVANVAAAKRDLEVALKLAGEGKMRAAIEDRLPLDRVNDALQRLRERRVLGRNVIAFP